MRRSLGKLVLVLTTLGISLCLSGCSDTEQDSQLPWNTPKGWEGAPPGMGMPGTGSGSY